MKPKLQPTKPFLMMLYGYPGSGKSFFARQFADELSNTVHLHADKMESDLADQLHGINEHSSAVPGVVMKYMAQEYLRNGISVIVDAPVTKKGERKMLHNLALANKAVPVLVWLQIDPESSFARTKKRDRRKTEDKYAVEYTDGEFQSIISNSQNPNSEEFIVISGKHTFHSQKSSVFKKLGDIGILNIGQVNHNVVKPELVNLVPSINKRSDILRRNISIR
jgi:predicted kinase